MKTVKYKANIATPTTYTGYLVDGTKNVPMAEGNKGYQEVQTWISEGNTPEDAYTQAELDAYAQSQIIVNEQIALNNIVVFYNGSSYSGSPDKQSEMVTAMAKLEGKNDNKTQKWYTEEGIKVNLNRDDLDNLLDMIEPLQEDILDD